MASTPPSSGPSGAVVVDANITIALAAREAGREAKAKAQLNAYSSWGYVFYAPGAVIVETLYILCQKHRGGLLTDVEYAQAVNDFELLMTKILPPPNGDASLIARASAIGSGYGCSRSSDSLYLALAEELTRTRPTTVLTFDAALPNQAASNVPTVTVLLLT